MSKTDNSNFSLPIPTHWIEYNSGDEVISNCELVALVQEETKQGETTHSPVICDYNEELKIFVAANCRAVEVEGIVTHYHVLHYPSGELIRMGE